VQSQKGERRFSCRSEMENGDLQVKPSIIIFKKAGLALVLLRIKPDSQDK